MSNFGQKIKHGMAGPWIRVFSLFPLSLCYYLWLEEKRWKLSSWKSKRWREKKKGGKKGRKFMELNWLTREEALGFSFSPFYFPPKSLFSLKEEEQIITLFSVSKKRKWPAWPLRQLFFSKASFSPLVLVRLRLLESGEWHLWKPTFGLSIAIATTTYIFSHFLAI